MEGFAEWFKRQEKRPHAVKKAKVKLPKKPDIPKPEPGKALDSFIKAVDNLKGDWQILQAMADKKAKEPKKPPKKEKDEEKKPKGRPFGIPNEPEADEDEKDIKDKPDDQEDQPDEEKPDLDQDRRLDLRGRGDARRPAVRIS